MNDVLRNRRVLIVEDEALIVFLMEDTLHDLGCHVAGVAATPEAALAALDRSPGPDLVVLDLNLGGSKSYEVADALVARGIPFLIITGYSHDMVAEAHRHAPILRKPFKDEDLGRALTEALGAADLAPAGEPNQAVTHAR